MGGVFIEGELADEETDETGENWDMRLEAGDVTGPPLPCWV